jgi:hypothetical protein
MVAMSGGVFAGDSKFVISPQETDPWPHVGSAHCETGWWAYVLATYCTQCQSAVPGRENLFVRDFAESTRRNDEHGILSLRDSHTPRPPQ